MEFEFAVVDSLENVPEPFRPMYAKGGDGKFAVGEAFRGTADAILGLNKSLKASREDARNLKKSSLDLSVLADYGDTPEKIRDSFASKIKDLEGQLASGAKVNIEKIRADLANGHSQELGKLNKRIEALQGQLYTTLVENVATSAIVEAKGVPELLLPHVKKSIKVLEEDGKQSVCVVDASGDLRYSTVTGQPMSIKELVAEMKMNKTYGRAFDSEAPTGSGSDPASGRRVLPKKGENLTSVQKIAAGLGQIKKGSS